MRPADGPSTNRVTYMELFLTSYSSSRFGEYRYTRSATKTELTSLRVPPPGGIGFAQLELPLCAVP